MLVASEQIALWSDTGAHPRSSVAASAATPGCPLLPQLRDDRRRQAFSAAEAGLAIAKFHALLETF